MRLSKEAGLAGVLALGLLSGCGAALPPASDFEAMFSGSSDEPAPEAPPTYMPGSQVKNSTGEIWVERENPGPASDEAISHGSAGTACSIDMSHVLSGNEVVMSFESTAGWPCDAGDVINITTIPENYNDALEARRAAWDSLMTSARETIEDSRAHPAETSVIRAADWYDVIGQAALGGGQQVSSFSLFERSNQSRHYGPESCLMPLTYDTAQDTGRSARIAGQVASGGDRYDVAIILDQGRGGTSCTTGDIVLLPVAPPPPVPRPPIGIASRAA